MSILFKHTTSSQLSDDAKRLMIGTKDHLRHVVLCHKLYWWYRPSRLVMLLSTKDNRLSILEFKYSGGKNSSCYLVTFIMRSSTDMLEIIKLN